MLYEVITAGDDQHGIDYHQRENQRKNVAADDVEITGPNGPGPLHEFSLFNRPTLFGFFFWMLRGESYRPAYTRVATTASASRSRTPRN